MCLDDCQQNLLYEIYGITYRQNTVVVGCDGNQRLQPDLYNSNSSVRDALETAINTIIATNNQCQCDRIKEILEEFKCVSLDPSNIDKDGYQFRPNKVLDSIRRSLYPYTGILYNKNCSHAGNKFSCG